MGPPERTTQDHHQTNDHGAWSLPPCAAPWSDTTPATCPGRTGGGTGEHLLFSCSPANRPAPWRWASSLVGQAAACARAMRRAQVCRRPPASHPRPPQRHPFPSGPCGQTTTPPADHGGTSKPLRPTGRPASPSHSRASAVRTARLPSRRHRRPIRPDTWMAPVAWTPDAWTPDVRSTDWTDVRTADRGRGQGDDRRGRCPDIARDRRPLAGAARSRPGGRVGALGHP